MKSVLEAMTELVSRGYPKDTAYRIANGDLPMDQASRDARRREMGYDKKVYHTGAADITEFDPHAGVFDRADTGTFVTDDRILAQTYMDEGKQIYPLYIRDREMPYIDADDAYFSDIDGDLLTPRDELIESFEGASTNEIARFAGEEGLPGVEFRGVKDPGPHARAPYEADRERLLELVDIFDGNVEGDIPIVYSVQDPTLIRSQFAAFDPEYKGANILGGTAATAVGAGALMAPEDASAAIEDVDIFEEEMPMNRRQRAQAQRERLAGDSEPLLSGAQTANLLAGLTGVAGVADIFGEYPEFPEGDVSGEEMVLEGQRGRSLAENISEGNYLSAGLQGLGVLPIVGIGARAAAKALRSADGITSLPINKQIEVMETVREGTKLDAPVFAPKIFEEGGKPDVRRMEAALKSNQGDLSSIDDMVERAQNVNDGFQSNVAEVAEAVGGKKAGKFITLKDGSQFDVEVKSRKSIGEKIERKGLTPSEFTDGVRTTIYVDTADQAEEAVQRLGALYPSIDRGWQRLPDTGYFDRKMNLAIEDPKTGGYIVGEIQIKTPEMAEAAIPGHRWYEYSRKLEGRYDHEIPSTKIQLYKKALEEQRRLYGEAESVADPEILRQLVEKFKAGGAVASPRRSHRSGIQTLAEGYPRLP
jgi:hypothetical protein